MSAVVSLTEYAERKKNIKKTLMQEAFYWAVREQNRLCLMAEPLEVIFSEDKLELEDKNCVVSVYYNEETGRAIMRRDWLDVMAVKYNILVNFDKIKKDAPNAAETMMENAIKIYRYYDGPGGGTTHHKNSTF